MAARIISQGSFIDSLKDALLVVHQGYRYHPQLNQNIQYGVWIMQITIDLPEELVQHFNHDRLGREILESLVIQAYKTEKITHAEVGRILGLPSRWVVDAFLKQHHADLHYDEADLERDRLTLHQLRAKPISGAL
jgi:predicted HTH domain antitoxin